MNELLTISEASEILGVSIDCLRKWEQRGYLFPHYTQGGHRRYDKSHIEVMMEVWKNPVTYMMQYDTFRPLPQFLKIIGSASVGEAGFYLDDGQPPKGYGLLEVGVYQKMNQNVAPLHVWGKEIMFHDTDRDSPVWLGNYKGKYTDFKIENECLYLSTMDIWQEEKHEAWLDNKRMMAPELIWGMEFVDHRPESVEIRCVCYRRNG